MKEKKLNKIAIKILKDAEKAFRKEPEASRKTKAGLCYFVKHHVSIVKYNDKEKKDITSYILQEKYSNSYTFGLFGCGQSQKTLWLKENTKYLRADWCKEQLLERFGIEV